MWLSSRCQRTTMCCVLADSYLQQICVVRWGVRTHYCSDSSAAPRTLLRPADTRLARLDRDVGCTGQQAASGVVVAQRPNLHPEHVALGRSGESIASLQPDRSPMVTREAAAAGGRRAPPTDTPTNTPVARDAAVAVEGVDVAGGAWWCEGDVRSAARHSRLGPGWGLEGVWLV
jgi:hypothetical protein